MPREHGLPRLQLSELYLPRLRFFCFPPLHSHEVNFSKLLGDDFLSRDSPTPLSTVLLLAFTAAPNVGLFVSFLRIDQTVHPGKFQITYLAYLEETPLVRRTIVARLPDENVAGYPVVSGQSCLSLQDPQSISGMVGSLWIVVMGTLFIPLLIIVPVTLSIRKRLLHSQFLPMAEHELTK